MQQERLVVALEARIRDFERNMQKAGQSAGRNFDQIERRAKQSGDRLEKTMAGASARVGGVFKNFGAGLVAGVAAGGIGGLATSLGHVAKGIATIGDEAKRAGLSTKAFQELKFVAEQNRVGVDSLVDGIKELNLRADEFIVTGAGPAAEAFNRLGFTATDLRQKLRDPSALFTEIISKLEHLDRAAQIRIADEIFGGTGGEKFVQLIDRGEKGIRDQIQAANDLGIVLDDEIIERAAEIDRKFQAITATVGTGLKAAIVDAASALSMFIDTFRQIEARQTRTLQEQLAFHQKNLTAAQNRKAQGVGILGPVFDKQIETSQAEVDRLRNVLRDRALDGIRDDLARSNAMYEGQSQTGGKTGRLPPTVTAAPVATGGRGGASRAGSALSANNERQAVADLIAELEEELRLIGATDAERRAAEASRDAGAAATDEERRKIIALNEAIHQEGAALDANRDQMQMMADGAKDFISGFRADIMSGVPPLEALGNAVGRLSDRLFDELLNAIFAVNDAGGMGGGMAGGIFGWIGKLFGFSGGGMVKADAWSGLRLAGGGHVRGPGTSTSDSIPAMLSDGEFVVNARATAKHRRLLEAVNDNRLPGFASGGLVGSGTPLFAGNDNRAPQIAISAPITIHGSAGTPAQNDDLAKKMARQMEATMRGVVADEIRKQSRPGNSLSRAMR